MNLLLCSICFLFGVWVTGGIIFLILGGADPEGRFKLRYAIFWPYYLKLIFNGKED
jgi:hypothetical protein